MVGQSVAANLEKIRARIAAAARRSGRKLEDIHLLAVSKKQDLHKIRSAYDHGQRDFAENYVQEARTKLEQLQNLRAAWHFIGRIQSNKLKMLAGSFEYIHSIDRIGLLKALNDLSVNGRQKIFLQYNVASETSKGGAAESELESLLNEALKCANLEVMGLMVMPPLFENAEEARPLMKQARLKLESLKAAVGSSNKAPLNQLSMGTSHDFEIAVEEGSTWIRIGSEIFGPREE